MPSERKLKLKFFDAHYQFNVTFMLYVDFDSILEAVDEKFRIKIIQIKTE